MFIALKRMAAVASLRSATVGSERRWCQAFVLVLRACSYKTKAKAWQQGNAHILFKGWMSVFVNRNDTDEHELLLSA